MAFNSQNGTTLGSSATLPATYDAAGYAAVTFTAVGEVIDFGELGRVYSSIAHQAVGRSYPEKIKGTYDIPDVTITVASQTADAGQVVLAAALAAAASYSFKLTLPSADTASFTGKVTKMAVGAAATNGIDTRSITIAIDPVSLFEA